MIEKFVLPLIIGILSSCSVVFSQTTTSEDMKAGAVVVVSGKNTPGETLASRVKESLTTSSLLETVAQRIDLQTSASLPRKTMKVIDTPETTITVIMVAAPDGHEDSMERLRDAYTSAGLASDKVADLLQIDAKLIQARNEGNTSRMLSLRDERNQRLSVKDRQYIRKFLVHDAKSRKDLLENLVDEE